MKFKYTLTLVSYLLFAEEIIFSKNLSLANTIKNDIYERSYLKKNNKKSSTLFSLNNDQFGLNIKNELITSQNNLLNLLVNNPDPVKNKFLVDIVSDIQYEQNNKYYAEGNVVIYFSDAKLTGDYAVYDRNKKEFTINGKVTFTKGSQYFEASKLLYNFEKENGSVDNIYGVLDINDINQDLDLKSSNLLQENSNSKNDVSNLEYINSASLGLVNNFDANSRLNLNSLKFDIPQIQKWRFKSDKVYLEANQIKSKSIFFTNDAFNKPQFLLQSKNFSGEIIDKKLKIISRNSWIILDDLLKFPIGRRTIFDDDPITTWGIGSDYDEKDGFYIQRTFGDIDIFENYSLRLTPNFLLQRSLKGNSDSFRNKNQSILNDKEKTDITFLDTFALDADISGKIFNWDLLVKSSLNSLDFDRFNQANRSKFTLTKTFDLNSVDESNLELLKLESDSVFTNNLDIQFYAMYREKVDKVFSGDEEIYFGKGARIANRKSWISKGINNDLSFIYDFGKFKAEKRDFKEFSNLTRNLFAIKYKNKIPLWEKYSQTKNINEKYKFSPKVVSQGINWNTYIDSGLFLYGDGSSQEAIILSSGPTLTLGGLTKKYLDYTSLDVLAQYVIKGNDSPFRFDNINNTENIRFNLKQQIYGPIVFGLSSYLNIDPNHNNYGEFTSTQYSLDISRRAYSFGAFYKPSSSSVGIQFNIFNFDYLGSSSSF